jgi:hypothetical protein
MLVFNTEIFDQLVSTGAFPDIILSFELLWAWRWEAGK